MSHAIYPGSFDPPTLGHMHIIERGALFFESLTVFIAVNPDKKSWLPVEQRLVMLQDLCTQWPNVKVESGEGLLVDHAQRLHSDVILRGLRSSSDLEPEMRMAVVNRQIGGPETMFLLSAPEHAFISSSLVRQVFKLGGDISSFVPLSVSSGMKRSSK